MKVIGMKYCCKILIFCFEFKIWVFDFYWLYYILFGFVIKIYMYFGKYKNVKMLYYFFSILIIFLKMNIY